MLLYLRTSLMQRRDAAMPRWCWLLVSTNEVICAKRGEGIFERLTAPDNFFFPFANHLHNVSQDHRHTPSP